MPARAAVAPRSYYPAEREISFQTPGASASAHGNEFLGWPLIFFNIKTKAGWRWLHPTHMEYQHQSQLRGRKKERKKDDGK